MHHPHLDSILTELKTELQQLYGGRLSQMILYGSQARGDAENFSDIDVMVVLRGQFDYAQEQSRYMPFVTALSLKYTTVVTLLLMPEHRFINEKSPLLINVRREGIALACPLNNKP